VTPQGVWVGGRARDGPTDGQTESDGQTGRKRRRFSKGTSWGGGGFTPRDAQLAAQATRGQGALGPAPPSPSPAHGERGAGGRDSPGAKTQERGVDDIGACTICMRKNMTVQ
jgi:hypothetical protein